MVPKKRGIFFFWGGGSNFFFGAFSLIPCPSLLFNYQINLFIILFISKSSNIREGEQGKAEKKKN